MKLIDAINNVDKSNPQWPPYDDLRASLDIQGYNTPNDYSARCKEYYIIKWYCTDEWVGLSVVYFDDKPVCVIQRHGRKMDRNIEWLNPESVKAMREFLAEEQSEPAMLNLEESIDEFYTVEYSEQLLTKNGFYVGYPVQVVGDYRRSVDSHMWHVVTIQNETGDKFDISLTDFKIPLHLNR